MKKPGNIKKRGQTEILIAEDSPTQAARLKYLLETHNFKILLAENGKEALKILSGVTPAIVISDIVMPEMDGYQLCREIKSENKTKNIPVILLTVLSDPMEIIEGLSCGADSFITKPYNDKYILSLIDKILIQKNMPDRDKVPFSTQILFKGRKRIVQTEQNKVINLLLNVYEGAVHQNEKLIQTQEELKSLNEKLESFVEDRTADLKEEIRLSNQISEKLRESEEKWKTLVTRQEALLSAVPDIIMEVDNNKVYTWANKAGFEFYGKDVLGRRADYYFEGEQDTLEKVKPLFEGIEDKMYVESWQRRQDGERRLLAWWCCALRNSKGEIIGAISSSRDISERKHAENTINNERILLRTLIDNLPDPIYVMDNQGCKVIANKADVANIGLMTEAEVIGKNDIELFAGEIGERGHADNVSVITSGNPIINREEFFLDKDGSRKWLLTSKIPLFDRHRNINGLVGIGRDITKRKYLTEELKKNQAQLINALKIARMGAWEYDVEADTFIFNDPFYEIFRTTAEQEGGYIMKSKEYLKRFVHPGDLHLVGAEISKAIESNDFNYNRQLEHRFQYADGETGYLTARFLIVKDEKGKTVRSYGVNQDITEMKKTEIELIKAKEKAEEGDRLKTAFLHNISHEIRTPMNAIVGFSALLGEPGIDSQTQQSHIQAITQSSNHLLSIISDIVDISNIEANLIKIHKSDIDINLMLKDIRSQLLPVAEGKHLDLIIESGLADADSKVITDATKFRQILSNLINNAIKFTEKGRIKVNCTRVGEFIEFSVSDTGIGIPEELHERIFERFYQVQYDKSRLYEGTGLGLAISKAYTDLLGGTIRLSSNPGNGSVFYLTIPFEKPVENIPPASSDTFPRSTRFNRVKTILVAEDVESNFDLINYLLAGTNVRILRAKNGKEVVETALKDRNIDIILMDIKMPEMDGYTATRLIREAGINVPVIAQTAYAHDSEKAIESGCSGFVSKPFDRKKLLNILAEFIK